MWKETNDFQTTLPEQTPLKTIPKEQSIEPTEVVEEAPEPVAVAGKVLVQLAYTPSEKKLTVQPLKIEDLPSPERGGPTTVEVHVRVLPERMRRCKTRAVSVEDAVFDEVFYFSQILSDEMRSLFVRMRVYGCQSLGKMLIGELRVPMNKIDVETGSYKGWENLQPKGLGDDEEEDGNFNVCEISSLASFGESLTVPELLVNLHYKDLTGRLSVEVIRGANLKREYMLLNPDTYVKIKVISSKGKKIGRSKTTVRRNNSDPEYNETFVYTMSIADLNDATMMFTLYGITKKRASKKKSIIGWFAFGKNTSGSGETNHWKEMVQNPDMDICHWRQLLSSG